MIYGSLIQTALMVEGTLLREFPSGLTDPGGMTVFERSAC